MRSVREGGECSSGTRRQYLRLSGKVPVCKSAGSAGHRYAGHIMPPLTCQAAKHRAYQAEQNTLTPPESFICHGNITFGLSLCAVLGFYKKEQRSAHLWSSFAQTAAKLKKTNNRRHEWESRRRVVEFGGGRRAVILSRFGHNRFPFGFG